VPPLIQIFERASLMVPLPSLMRPAKPLIHSFHLRFLCRCQVCSLGIVSRDMGSLSQATAEKEMFSPGPKMMKRSSGEIQQRGHCIVQAFNNPRAYPWDDRR